MRPPVGSLLAYWMLSSACLKSPVSTTGSGPTPTPTPTRPEDNDDDDYHDEPELSPPRPALPNVVNITATDRDEKGLYVGAACERACSPRLQHAYCNPVTGMCECDKKYPVKLNNPYAGCSVPNRLGDQCYYKEACQYTDQHASCIQVHHNAVCQCESGYHSVSILKPSKKVFCAEDVVIISTDFSTFAGVLSGIAILSGLICFVLHLFNQNLYGSHHGHRFGNANLPPPILFSSDPGPLPIPALCPASRPPSANQRRASSAPGFRPRPLRASGSQSAQTSRAGSRRPSIASVHSASSIRSYSQRRYEREREQKEEREMQRRLSKMKSSSTSRIPTPSPHSTDDLLPTLEEDKQQNPPLATKEDSTTSFQEENLPSTSKQSYP